MAKDGTVRGSNIKVGAGRKPKALAEKIETGNPGGRKLKVLELPEPSSLSGSEMPEPSEYLSAQQKDGTPLGADEIYRQVWLWLKDYGCEKLVSKQLLEEYSVNYARWIQCQNAMNNYGLLSKHPTTGAACTSPFVSMAAQFNKQMNASYYLIMQVVKENCSVDFKASEDDLMDRLLRSRKV